MPARFNTASCWERLAFEMSILARTCETGHSRLPSRPSWCKRVELAKALQIRSCLSRISESISLRDDFFRAAHDLKGINKDKKPRVTMLPLLPEVNIVGVLHSVRNCGVGKA